MENGIHTFMKYKILRGKTRIFYSLRPVILFANIDISRHILHFSGRYIRISEEQYESEGVINIQKN
jgi:hypothetical protein